MAKLKSPPMTTVCVASLTKVLRAGKPPPLIRVPADRKEPVANSPKRAKPGTRSI